MDEQLLERVRRLHVAIGRTADSDLAKFPAKVYSGPQGHGVFQDFSGGRSEAEMSDALHGLIHNIASFHDHLKKWGEGNGVCGDDIHSFLKASSEFCVVRDLWNNDKHGYPPDRNDGWSRRAPRLNNVRSECQLLAGPSKNASATMTLGRGGRPVATTTGGSSVRVIVTGEVVDKNGNGMGDAHRIIEAAIRVCEAAIQRFIQK